MVDDSIRTSKTPEGRSATFRVQGFDFLWGGRREGREGGEGFFIFFFDCFSCVFFFLKNVFPFSTFFTYAFLFNFFFLAFLRRFTYLVWISFGDDS